jgi:glyoxylase-like metal-dependent hydrolase (beta-lactamase superfamily II)
MYKKLVVGPLQTNCYLYFSKNRSCLIVDPGDDAEYITDKINEYNLNPIAIIATHGHFDHILSVDQLKKTFNIPFLVSKKDEFLVKSMAQRAKKWLGRKIYEQNPKIDNYLEDKLSLEINKLKIIKTPGHTPGGICIYVKEEKLLFTGDTIFSDGYVGRTDFSYSNKLDLENSIKLILQLPDETKILSGHGEETNVKKEKKYHKKY